jgi:hypothetical protein
MGLALAVVSGAVHTAKKADLDSPAIYRHTSADVGRRLAAGGVCR